MKKWFERAQFGMLGGLALAAPLQGYSYVPYLDVSFSGLLVFVMLVLWVIRARSNPVRMPWEYWWPLLGVLGAAMWSDVFWDALAPMLALLLTVQFVRSRARAEFTMWLVSCSLGVFALLNAVAHQAGFAPTAHSYYNQAIFVGAYTVPHGILLLMIGVLWGTYITAFSKLEAGLRTASFFSAFFCLGVLGGKLFLLRGHVYDWSASPIASGSAATVVGGVFLAWLACRIVAKLWVTRAGVFAPFVILGGTTLLIVVYVALFPMTFAVYAGVLVGIAAAFALPDREEVSVAPVFPYVPAVLVIALSVANAQQAYPDNERDGRNVDTVLEQDWERGAFDRVHRRASNLLLVYPDKDAALFSWMAKASLGLGLHERASKELAMAGSALGVSTNEDIAERLDVDVIELRDALTQLDREKMSFAYERALVGLGERGSALAVLKMKVDSGLVNLPETWSRETKAFVYAALLGDVSLEDEIASWASLELPVVGALWEGVVRAEGMPAPVFWILDRWPDRCVLYAVLGERADLSERVIARVWLEDETATMTKPEISVHADADLERAGWYVVDVNGDEVASFLIEDGRLARTSLHDTGLDALPYGPVVRYQRGE